MTISSDMTARQQLVGLLEFALQDVEKQQAFVNACFLTEPKLLGQIKTGQAARVFAIHLVTTCMMYGNIGKSPAVLVVLDELSAWLGADYTPHIQRIRQALAPASDQTHTAEMVRVMPGRTRVSII